MNEQIKFPSQDEIRDAVLLVLAFPNPEEGTEDTAYLKDLERGVLRVLKRVLNWPDDDDFIRREYLISQECLKTQIQVRSPN
jgi:hypothetical protein